MNGFARALHLVGGEFAAPLRAATVRVAAEQGLSPVLIDLSAWSGGSDVLLGLEHAPGVRWHDLDGADGEFDADGLFDRLPVGPLGERVLAHDRHAASPVSDGIVRAAVHALRLSASLLIIDVVSPVASADIHRAGDGLWVIAGDEVRSTAAGVAAAQWFSRHGFVHGTLLLGDGVGGSEDFDTIDGAVRVGRTDRRDLERGVLCGRRRSSLRAPAERMIADLVGSENAA